MEWKWIGRLLAVVIEGLLIASCSVFVSPTPTATPVLTPGPPLTAKEAYRLAEPAIRAWHEDAVVEYVGTPTSNHWVYDDGTSQVWYFGITTVHTKTGVVVYGKGAVPVIGYQGIPGFEKSGVLPDNPISPLDELEIDSDEAVEIVLRHGVSSEDRLIEIELTPPSSYYGVPLSWKLTYGDADDIHSYRKIFIDAHTGEVVGHNDFAE